MICIFHFDIKTLFTVLCSLYFKPSESIPSSKTMSVYKNKNAKVGGKRLSNLSREHKHDGTFGTKIIIGFFIFSAIIFTIGQGGAVIAYDNVANWGLQFDKSDSADPVVIVVNRGTGLADVIVGVPLFVVAAIGLSRLKFYGAVASWLGFGMNLYWPVVAWTKQRFYVNAGVDAEAFDVPTHLLLISVFAFSAWASWYLYRNKKLFQ